MKVLVVDDDEVTRKLLREVLQREGYEVCLAVSGEEALALTARESFPVVVSDIRMLEIDGLALLSHIKKSSARTVVILMTGFGSMEGAVQAIKEGAFDYISKPFRIEDLKTLVGRAVKHWQTQAPHSGQNKSTVAEASFAERNFIGKSPQIVEVYKTVALAALSPSNVLIHGESGTGKELVARAIHDNSVRRTHKFIALNCGALTETLLESELFGHLRGAFTGATADKRGLFEEAHQGTLFLDEIGDVPAPLQVKLLRVLQEGEVRPVGSNQTRRVDVRVIAATHRDLDTMVREGKFRDDLYYRLKVIGINLPPLRGRMDDLPELVNYFLARSSAKNHKTVSHVSDEAMKMLQGYAWPGNIRELEHAIERAVAMTRTSVLFPEDFPPELFQVPAPQGSHSDAGVSATQSLEEVEREHILRVLQDVNFNKSKASEILGIDRATLYRKAQRYGIDLGSK